MKKKPVLFVYVDQANKDYIDKLTREKRIKISTVVNTLITAHRHKIAVDFKDNGIGGVFGKKA